MKKYLIIILLSGLVLGFTFFFQSQNLQDAKLHLVFCDVGQGDGIYIRTADNADIVIDGGQGNGKMLKCLEKYMPTFDREIELMFATHPDADHIGGLVQVLRSYTVKEFASSTDKNLNETRVFENLKEEVAKQKIAFKVILAGDKYSLTDGTSLTTYWPTKEFSSSDTNDYSLVQVLRYKDFEALLTGDVTYQILDDLNVDGAYEVFKIPHHGSKTGVDDVTFQKITASFVPISAGLNNKYFHPNPSVLALLKKYGIEYGRTDKVGSIEIITDGKNSRIVTN